MKTFGKVLLIVILALVCLRLLPLLMGASLLALAVLFGVAIVLAGGVAAVAATGLTAVAALLAVVLVVAAVLTPIWLPVLAIAGLVSLCRRSGKTAAA